MINDGITTCCHVAHMEGKMLFHPILFHIIFIFFNRKVFIQKKKKVLENTFYFPLLCQSDEEGYKLHYCPKKI